MKTYVVTKGDTFERISTISYGSSEYADLIKSANAQASGGLTVGMVITIPTRPIDATTPPRVEFGGEDEVTATIDGEPFRYWTGANFRFAMDEFATFSFVSPFDPTNEGHKATFVPFKFQDVQASIGGELELTGTVLGMVPGFSAASRTVTVDGYARSAVLTDCPLPVNVEREADAATLSEIAAQMCKPFGLVPSFDPGNSGEPLDRVAISDSQKVFPYLTKLSKQRGFIISNDVKGQPVFQKETKAGNPVQDLTEGVAPLEQVTPQFNARAYYSYISSIAPTFHGFGGENQTVDNPFLNGVIRPFTFKADDASPAANLEAAQSKIGRMFADALSYNLDLAGWRDAQGDLWRPNTTLTLLAPGAMIYKRTELLIRSVDFSRSKSKSSVRLNVVLPGSFSGKVPETLPWLE